MEQLRRSVVKPTFKSDTEYITESDELAGIEIKMNKSRVTEDVPIHFAIVYCSGQRCYSIGKIT